MRKPSRKEELEEEEKENVVEKKRQRSVRVAHKANSEEDNSVRDDGDDDDEVDAVAEKRLVAKRGKKGGVDKVKDFVVEEDSDVSCEDFLASLERAEEDVKTVFAMLKEAAASEKMVLKLENMAVPDPTAASPARGAVLVTKKEDLICCLQEPEPVDQIERWGDLLRCRRVAKRAFEIAGLFAFLRSRDSVGGMTITARYKYAIKDMEKVFSFSHAARYDRLGRFLLEFPQFVSQLQFVKLNDWFQKVNVAKGKSVVVMDAVKRLLSDDQIEFWKKQPEEVCLVCAQTQIRARLWKCPECGVLFHEMCAGYDGFDRV